MTRRTWLILSAVVLVSLVGVGGYLLIPPKPGVTRANFLRLHRGMSLEQVEAILGRKPDDDMYVSGGCIAFWRGRQGDIEIDFSDGATGGSFREHLAPQPHGFLVTARSWLERNGFLAPDPKALPDISEVIRAADRKAELDHHDHPPLDPSPR